MPRTSWTTSPACRTHRASSLGRMKRAYSWVPLGSSLSTCSAPTIANAKDFRLRLIVETKTQPPGLTRVASARTTDSGDRKSTRLNSSHHSISYAVFCLKKKKMDLKKTGHHRHENTRERYDLATRPQ